MPELVYFVAVSADGFIASPEGAYDFFPAEGEHLLAQAETMPETIPEHARATLGAAPYATDARRRRFGSVIMGRHTYEPALRAGLVHPYAPLPTVVFSRTLPERDDGTLRITAADPVACVTAMKAEGTADIWLCGGEGLATQLAPLVDTLILKVNPVLVHNGLRLWQGPFRPRELRLRRARPFASGVVWLDYECL
jgi:dihydrofolate reductase